MFKRSIFAVFAAAAFLFAGASAANAQTAPVRGKVVLMNADGTKTPVENALVEPYRSDVSSGKAPAATTNKRGEFSFAGFQLGARFILAVSGPGIAPAVQRDVAAGADVEIVVGAGDGRKFTEEEARASATTIAATGTSPEATEEQKKAEAEYQKQLAEYNAKKAAAEETNRIVNAALTEGNSAYQAKNYDLAVAKYDEGYKADPEFVGSAPVMLNNKGLALNGRATATYNANVKAEATQRIEAMKKVREDLAAAIDSFDKSWKLLTSAQPGANSNPATLDAQKQTALSGARDTFRLMVATEQADLESVNAGRSLIEAVMKAETDKAKKMSAKLALADAYRVAQDMPTSLALYKEILTEEPENPDALAGAGLTAAYIGWEQGDNNQLQESANYLSKFDEVAPANHKFKPDAAGIIAELKKANIAPTKSPARRRN